jgi:hypothetical protein
MTSKQRISLGRAGVLVLSVAVLQACSDSTPAAPVASAVEAAASLGATATVASQLTLAVVVQDDRGRPVPGTPVTFEVTAGGGTLAASAVVTNTAGRAEARWTLGTTAGLNTAVARATGRTVTFSVEGTPAAPAQLATISIPPLIAAAGEDVGAPLTVRVTDSYGNGVAGVTVEFAVTRGGGSVAGTGVVTDAGGHATAGAWTMGPLEGENVLTATVANLPPVTFTIRTVEASAMLQLAKFAGDSTTCPTTAAGCVFTVRVTNRSGAPAPGEAIIWTGPGRTPTVETTYTNASGFASAPNLGTRLSGSYMQSARLLSSGEEVAFSYDIVEGGSFNIDIRFMGGTPNAVVLAAFQNARERWQRIITGNLPNVQFTQSAGTCAGVAYPALDEVVDDLIIFVLVTAIDGPGGTLGSAGPCWLRGEPSGLPVIGGIRLDSDDLDRMATNGTLTDVILHEIGHVLGIGTLWSRPQFSLLQGAGGSDPRYTGRRARHGFVLGGGLTPESVPVENTGGPGTRDGHWREVILSNELMTGFVNSAGNPLSSITIGSLMDLGYQVNFGAADPYLLPGVLGPNMLGFGTVERLAEEPIPPPRYLW